MSTLISYVDGAKGPIRVSTETPFPVTLTGTSGGAQEVEITNDQGNAIPVSGPVTDTQLRASPVPVMDGLQIPHYNEVALTYTLGNLTGVVYKLAGATVATLALSYTDNVLTGVLRS